MSRRELEIVEVLTPLQLATLLGEKKVLEAGSGGGRFKTYEDMWHELEAGEMQLAVDNDGTLYRVLHVARVSVSHKDDVLIETFQGVFEKRFSREDRLQIADYSYQAVDCRHTPYPIWQKFKAGEDAAMAARRSVSERLFALDEGLSLDDLSLAERSTEVYEEEPRDFPGLVTELHAFDFEIELPEQLLRSCYYEIRPERTTVFSWVPRGALVSYMGVHDWR